MDKIDPSDFESRLTRALETPDFVVTSFESGDLLHGIGCILSNYGIRTWHEVGNFSEAPTGQKYETVCSAGRKSEGAHIIWIAGKEMAVSLFLGIFEGMAKEAVEMAEGDLWIYWRHHPEVLTFNGLQTVYTRFLISDRPQIQSADYDSNA